MPETKTQKRSPSRLWTVGVDVGSMAVKAVLMHGTEWVDRVLLPTGWNPSESGAAAIRELAIGRKKIARTVATGYGRAALLPDKVTPV